MERRYFEFLYNEICVELDRRISRYDLWLGVWDCGGDPDELTRDQARAFLAKGLDCILREEGKSLRPRARRRLERRVLGFDSRFPTPEEWLTGLLEPSSVPRA
jgi:hypothetical protein